jgi:hypothetical protein
VAAPPRIAMTAKVVINSIKVKPCSLLIFNFQQLLLVLDESYVSHSDLRIFVGITSVILVFRSRRKCGKQNIDTRLATSSLSICKHSIIRPHPPTNVLSKWLFRVDLGEKCRVALISSQLTLSQTD